MLTNNLSWLTINRCAIALKCKVTFIINRCAMALKCKVALTHICTERNFHSKGHSQKFLSCVFATLRTSRNNFQKCLIFLSWLIINRCAMALKCKVALTHICTERNFHSKGHSQKFLSCVFATLRTSRNNFQKCLIFLSWLIINRCAMALKCKVL